MSKERLWFTADTHFGHKNVIKMDGRPYGEEDINSHDEDLIYRWNQVVQNNDFVWHLGDFAYGCQDWRIINIFNRLNGKICMIWGNHDRKYLRKLWEQDKVNLWHASSYHEIFFHKQRIVMCHYALRTWHNCWRGAYNLHGHSHGGLDPYPRQMDVGVTEHNYAPVSFWDIKKILDQQQMIPHKHKHDNPVA